MSHPSAPPLGSVRRDLTRYDGSSRFHFGGCLRRKFDAERRFDGRSFVRSACSRTKFRVDRPKFCYRRLVSTHIASQNSLPGGRIVRCCISKFATPRTARRRFDPSICVRRVVFTAEDCRFERPDPRFSMSHPGWSRERRREGRSWVDRPRRLETSSVDAEIASPATFGAGHLRARD